MNFIDKVIQLQDEAKNYILSKLQDGEKIELISEQQIVESEDNDILYDLPQADYINKYNELVSYAIIAIEREGESLNLYGFGIGENFGMAYIFSFYELTANQICWIADYLK